MTIAREVIRLMSDGKPWTSKQLAEATGRPVDQIQHAVRSAATRGFADASPVTYTINARGLEKAVREPKSAQQRKAENTARRREARKAPMSASTVVEKAQRSRSPLEQAWGVFGSVHPQ